MLLLDTSVLARWMDPDRAQTVVPYLSEHASEEFTTSSLVVFELFRTATRRRRSQDVHAWLGQSLASIEPFTDQAAVTAAQAEAALSQYEPSLALRDLLIVAHAKALDATFVTADASDFQSEPIQQLFEIDIIYTG
jgi:predicted nucleic acid-binding protein